jgi:TctA family transporter
MSGGDATVLFSSNLGNLLWVILIATLVLPSWLNKKKAKSEQ